MPQRLQPVGINEIVVALLLFLFGMSSEPASANETNDDIDTNRPSFMASPLVVPRGSLQLENGAIFQHSQHGVNYFNAAETELRLGLTKSTELQMFVPQWALQQTSTGSGMSQSPVNLDELMQSRNTFTQSGVTGFGEIGLKHQFKVILNNLNYALIAGVNVPISRRAFSGTDVQPVVRLPWTKSINKKWSLGGMESILVVNSGRDVQWQNSVLISRSIGTRTAMFAEYGGFYTHQARSMNIAHFGAIRKLNKNNQIDLQFGFGMDKTAPAAFVGAGYSFRFDRLPLIEKL